VKFETLTLQGNVKDHMSRISIATDEGADPIDLFLKAEIERIYDVTPSVFSFEPMGAKQVQRVEVKVLLFSHEGEPPYDPEIVSSPDGVKADVAETTDGVRPVLLVGATAGPGLPRAGVQGEVILRFRFGKGAEKVVKTIKIPVFVPVMADVHVKPSVLDFQAVAPDAPARSVPVVLELLDPDRVYTLGAPTIEGSTATRLKLDVEAVKPGRQYKLTLVAENGLPAADTSGHHGLVRIPTGLDDFPEVRLPYRAYTRAPQPKK
jgi:hypothetical protein